jgi:hypothetical protein
MTRKVTATTTAKERSVPRGVVAFVNVVHLLLATLPVSIDGHAIELADEDSIASKMACLLADDDGGSVLLVGAFKPARDIHGVADDRVVESHIGPDVSD